MYITATLSLSSSSFLNIVGIFHIVFRDKWVNFELTLPPVQAKERIKLFNKRRKKFGIRIE